VQTKVKTKAEITSMRESGRMLAAILNLLKSLTKPGLSTQDLADAARKELQSFGAEPSFLDYQGFPDVLCTSINDEVVHGIPSPLRIITEGDILSLDFGVTFQGMITDGAISFIVGNAKNPKHTDLVKTTKEALYMGINSVHDKVRTGDIGAAVEEVLNRSHYGIVRDLVGHGVGHHLHEDPNIPNYGRKNTGPWLDKGMTIAIEPMATLGRDDVFMDSDGWTIITRDHSMSAHFEHTVLITENGAEILTLASDK
jgi:methionyl aminopeptidase